MSDIKLFGISCGLNCDLDINKETHIIKGVPKNLRMGKWLKMIEGIIATDSFWS